MIYDLRFKNSVNENRGFIALISVIVVSAILILIAVTLSLNQFYDRYNILESEYKERSTSLAEACVDNALLEIANDSGYTGNATSTINGTDQCYVGSIIPSSIEIFKTRGIYQNSYTNLKIKVDTSGGTLTVISWEEISTF